MNEARRGRAAARVALALLALTGLAGCDLVTGSDQEEGDIIGTWVLEEGGTASYLEVTSTTITVYDEEPDGCFVVRQAEILGRAGDRYTLSPAGSDRAFTYTIRRDADTLVITFEDRTITYQASDQDLSRLDVCTGGGSDPGIECSTLPAVSIGQTISGELTTSDSMDDGRYFDLYGLTLDAETAVQIDAASDVIDPYLYLYRADGTLIAQNDDAGDSTFDASIATTLQAGCYRIEVTSYFGEQVGPYTLSAN